MSVDQAVNELSTGQGYLLYERFFSPEIIQQARDLIYQLARDEPHRTSHFHGDDTETTQKRVWNLPAKGEIFRQLCSDERILAIMEPLLGDDLMLSSFAANILYPGAPAQEGHVDYPYWDLHARNHWPQTLNASFFLAVEVVITLDDFTLENGATAIVPGSQKLAAWPDPERFAAESIRLTIPAGSVFMFPALLWHAGQANRSQGNRAALLGSYTCKSIKPIEDWSRCIDPNEAARYSDRMQALLGLNYAYPAVMDALPGRSSEGARSEKHITTYPRRCPVLILKRMGCVKTLGLVCVLALPLVAVPVPNLRADSESQVTQNERADVDHLSRMADDAMVARWARLRLVVPVPEKTSNYYLHSVSKQRRFLRPWAKLLLDRLSQQYRARYSKQLRVTSLLRTVRYQNSLRKRNGNAASSTGPKASLHLTGACLDISKKGMTRAQQGWVRAVLTSLHDKNYLFAVEEFQQPVFHVMVHRKYEDYVAQRLAAKK